jgi:hypothetical protein
MSRKKCGCRDCVYSGRVRDGARTLYVCSNTPKAPNRTVVVPPDGGCPHFRPRPARSARTVPPEPDDPWVRHIPLTQGLYAVVDASDYPWLSLHNWCAKKDKGNYYAMRRHNGQTILMHQEIMVPAEGYVVDHINGHGWDCRRSNMRICTRTQNCRNRAKCRRSCGSQYKGVSRNRETGKFRARIGYQGERVPLGTFATELEAARAYDWAAVFFHGPYARLNLPHEWPPERRAAVYTQHLAPPTLKQQGKTEDRGRRTEGGKRKGKDRGQKTEDRQPKAKAGKSKGKKSGPPAS